MTAPALFQPLTLRGVTLKNRIGVSPMCMYSSDDGYATDFHLTHLGRFALGGAGLVIMEATAIVPEGRISPRDAGIWSDAHIEGLSRVTAFLKSQGAVAGIQLGHAGRRACTREPWHGGVPILTDDLGYGPGTPWALKAPSALAAGPGYATPVEMSTAEVERSVEQWAEAAVRAVAAGFTWIEIHGAHGYLVHEFLSPISNHRTDAYGGSPEGRRKYAVDVVRAIRAAVGDEIVVTMRISTVDGIEGGITVDDSLALARELRDAGVDLIDTSSGGITTDRSVDTRVRRGFSFHADFSRALRDEVPTATVGMVVDPHQAEQLVAGGDADIVLLGREMLSDPNWAVRAHLELGGSYDDWPVQFGPMLKPRAALLERLAASGETPMSRFTPSLATE